jgi:DMSO/TMAO reductase YedYZ molybdopterin-dependent catalytic subunit
MTEKPLNAETSTSDLRSWITANKVFFDRNQGQIPSEPVSLDDWRLTVTGSVKHELSLSMNQIARMPKTIQANTLECSGNGRSLLAEKASGNPWTIGGVGNAVWTGIWLKDILTMAGVNDSARFVAFEGLDTPMGSSKIKFIRSIPMEKAMSTTLLAYEMNGEPLPLKHGYPMRVLTLGWTGANCAKWLQTITVLDQPYEGFFMDRVYRVFQNGEEPITGEVVTGLKLKAIITRPLTEEKLVKGAITISGAAYAGEDHVEKVDVSLDNGRNWQTAEFIGPDEPFAWRHWQYVWQADTPGCYTIWARAMDNRGRQQPLTANWNVLGYGNNGIKEHGIPVTIA